MGNKTRNRASTPKKQIALEIPLPLYSVLQDYLLNCNNKITRTKFILIALETELAKRLAEIHAYERTKSAIDGLETSMHIIQGPTLISKNTGRTKAAGTLGTLAASHCPVNGPALPEGGSKS